MRQKRMVHPSGGPSFERRRFLAAAATGAACVALPSGARASVKKLPKPLRIGLLADLHQDIMHDGMTRLAVFLKAMEQHKPDALLQLGDFAHPSKANRPLIDRFNKASKTPLHVIGNHDTDAGHTKRQCLDVWGMPSRYYAHDFGPLRLLVLDGNDQGSPTHRGGYPSYIGPRQREWLVAQLAGHDGPIIIASHQPLAGAAEVDNAKEVRELISRHADKVLLAINGHTHIDDLLTEGGVPYLHINSASYYWVGGSHRHESYPPHVHATRPAIARTCPYRDSLFATLTIDPSLGVISLAGRKSQWVGASPEELEVKLAANLKHGEEIAPVIRERSIKAG